MKRETKLKIAVIVFIAILALYIGMNVSNPDSMPTIIAGFISTLAFFAVAYNFIKLLDEKYDDDDHQHPLGI